MSICNHKAPTSVKELQSVAIRWAKTEQKGLITKVKKYKPDLERLKNYINVKKEDVSVLSDSMVKKIIIVLYLASLKSVEIQSFWEQSKTLLWAILSKNLKYLEGKDLEKFKEWTGYGCVDGLIFNHESYDNTYGNRRQYKRIMNPVSGGHPNRPFKCICYTSCNHLMYVYNDSLQVYMVIGKDCMANLNEAKHLCCKCNKKHRKVKEEGKYPFTCPPCIRKIKEEEERIRREKEMEEQRKMAKKRMREEQERKLLEEKRKQEEEIQKIRNTRPTPYGVKRCVKCKHFFAPKGDNHRICPLCFRRMKTGMLFVKES